MVFYAVCATLLNIWGSEPSLSFHWALSWIQGMQTAAVWAALSLHIAVTAWDSRASGFLQDLSILRVLLLCWAWRPSKTVLFGLAFNTWPCWAVHTSQLYLWKYLALWFFGLHTAILHTTKAGVAVGLSSKCVTEKHTRPLCIPEGKWSQSSHLTFCVCLIAVCSCQEADLLVHALIHHLKELLGWHFYCLWWDFRCRNRRFFAVQNTLS